MSAAVGDVAAPERADVDHRLVKRRGWLVRRALLLADVLGLVTAFLVVQQVVGTVSAAHDELTPLVETGLFLLTLPVWVVVARLYGLYDRDEERTNHSTVDDVVRVFHLVTVGTWLVYLGASLTHVARPDLGRTAIFWALAVGSITFFRAVARTACRRHPSYRQKTLIVGADDVGQLVARKLLAHPEYGVDPIGFVDDSPRELHPDLGGLAVLGAPGRLADLVGRHGVERVVIAFAGRPEEELIALVRTLDEFTFDVQVDVVPRLYDLVGPGVDIHGLEGLPLVGLRPVRLSTSSRLLKRGFDLAAGSLLAVALAPLVLLVAVAVRLDSRGPVFFRQLRVGEGGRPFRIRKFRTMVANAEELTGDVAHLNRHARAGGDPRMFKIPDDPRTTRAGRLLRRYSIDELPQLLNVLRGEMSLVGPRPLILPEDRHVHDWARRRLDLKPGMTGLWQVLGRSEIPFDEMMKLDYRYVTTWSLWNDLLLLARTVPVVCRGERMA